MFSFCLHILLCVVINCNSVCTCWLPPWPSRICWWDVWISACLKTAYTWKYKGKPNYNLFYAKYVYLIVHSLVWFFFYGPQISLGGGLKSPKIIFDPFSRHFRQFWLFHFWNFFLYGLKKKFWGGVKSPKISKWY